jgi:hypothetical protein
MTPRSILAALILCCGCGDNSLPYFEPWELEYLSGADGFSIRIPEFAVPAGHESQNCFFLRVPDNAGADRWIHRVVTGINPGSHHMNVFRVKTIVELDPNAGEPIQIGEFPGTVIRGADDYENSPCWDSANWADWPLVANSQHANFDDPITDWTLPDQVAIRFAPGEMLMIQTHYVNSTDQPTLYGARVGINFYAYKDPAPPLELGTLFATQQNIRICRSQPDVTYSGTCTFPNDVTITAANGHFHKRGVSFSMFPWNGTSTQHPDPATMFYQSLAWDDPPMALDLGVSAAVNTGVWWDCAYHWTAPDVDTCADVDAKDPQQAGDCCYTFGGNTDVGEHCNVFMYYYPKIGSDVFCN